MSDFVPPNRADLMFLDVETSGIDPFKHELLEVAAVRVSSDFAREIGIVNKLCRMDHPEVAEKEALEVCGYDAARWAKESEHVRVALCDYSVLLGKDRECVVVAMNPLFDMSFIRNTADRIGLALVEPRYVLDLASIAWPLVVRGMIEKLSLQTLCTRYGVPNTGSHRAMPDVRRTMAVYRKLVGV